MPYGGPCVIKTSTSLGILAYNLARSVGELSPKAPPYSGVTGEPQILTPLISINSSMRMVALEINLRREGSASRKNS